MTQENKTSIEDFERFFSVSFVKTKEQKEQVFQLRYKVYCTEFKYELAKLFPDEQEFDEFDDYSLYCLITQTKTKMSAGCIRLVSGIVDHPLPFEKYCAASLNHNLLSELTIARHSICEISRLAVDPYFRQRTGEKSTRYGDLAAQEIRNFPLIAMANIFAALALADLTGKSNAFAMIEPFLPKLLKRAGISFEKIGKEIDYHGIKSPYLFRLPVALQNLDPDLKTLYDWIRNQINLTYLIDNSASLNPG